MARAVARTQGRLRLAGVETFEGALQMASDGEAAAAALLDGVCALASACETERLFSDRVLLTAGGSAFFDLVVDRFAALKLTSGRDIVLRSGCYLTHDDGMYAELFRRLQCRSSVARSIEPGLEPALQVWSTVLSRPEPQVAICGFGKRDAGCDADLPSPILWARPGDRTARTLAPGHSVVGLQDQHAFVRVPEGSPLRVGDLIGCGISHPCTTFDKWRLLLEVDDDYTIVGAIRTYF